MDPTGTPLSDYASIARTIQLAIAPVFLIAGVGAMLNVLTNRLARVVDRGRRLEQELEDHPIGPEREFRLKELVVLDKRMVRINRAIMLAVLAVLLVCVVIVAIFTGELVRLDLSTLIAVLFIAAMLALILALVSFMGEIAIATRSLRVSMEYRRK
jgi:hypothetical protein